MKRKTWIKLILIIFLFSANIFVWYVIWHETPNGILTVSFLDVGQGDAILITAPNKNQLLIDGGPDKKVLQKLTKEMPFYDRSIDLIIATHPDSDHIGGLPDVVERFFVGAFVESLFVGDSKTYKQLKDDLTQRSVTVLKAKTGMKIILDEGVYLEVLTAGAVGSDSNESSIVAILHYGDTSFLLTGDAPALVENYLVYTKGDKLPAQVLKVGHHGSKTSSSLLFLQKVQPEFAIISAGVDNRYGHPNQVVLENLKKVDAEILQTKDLGSVSFKTDGEKIMLVNK